MKLGFSNRFSKKAHIPSFIKIRPVGLELFHADGQTDVTKLIVAFRNFANAENRQEDTNNSNKPIQEAEVSDD
jgi:hypothetical protein